MRQVLVAGEFAFRRGVVTGPAAAMVYPSEFQRSQLEPPLAELGYRAEPAT